MSPCRGRSRNSTAAASWRSRVSPLLSRVSSFFNPLLVYHSLCARNMVDYRVRGTLSPFGWMRITINIRCDAVSFDASLGLYCGDTLFRRFILDIQIEPTPDGLRCRIDLSLTCVAHAALYNGGPSSSSTPTPFPTAKHN